jgi:hypothetical protein
MIKTAIAATEPIIPAAMYIVVGGSSEPGGVEGVGVGDPVGSGAGEEVGQGAGAEVGAGVEEAVVDVD